MELIREVGAFAGLAAFFGLAVLALLYFAQARDVRRLRENAEFLVEGEPVGEGPAERAAEPVPAGVAAQDPAAAARTAAAGAPSDAEAFRRAELARQAAERRQRFEERRRGERRGPGEILGSVPSTAVVVVGALILLAGVGFGATRLLGDDEPEGGGGGGGGAQLACPPNQTKVAVLNGTAEAGLAASFAQRLRQANYAKGPVTNTLTPFETSSVMFAQGSQQCAGEVGNTAGLPQAQAEPMSQEIIEISEGSAVAVVLGEDIASGQSSSDASSADQASAGTAVD